MNKVKVAFTEFMMRKLWRFWRNGIEQAAVAGSGGIVFLGDSITHNGRWDLMFPGIPTRNFGISGERSDHLLTRLEVLISLKPSKIFVLIGTNDLTMGATPEAIGSNVTRLVDELRRALPDCTIYLQAVMPRTLKYAARIKSLNAIYERIAQQRNLHFIDLFSLLDDGNGKLRKEFTHDDLHLLGTGYSVWRDAIRPLVVTP